MAADPALRGFLEGTFLTTDKARSIVFEGGQRIDIRGAADKKAYMAIALRLYRTGGWNKASRFLVGALANTLLVLGVTLMFGLFATTDYGELAARTNDSPQWMTLVAFGLVVVGVAFKLAAVPAHTWMPDVAEGAPPPAAPRGLPGRACSAACPGRAVPRPSRAPARPPPP